MRVETDLFELSDTYVKVRGLYRGNAASKERDLREDNEEAGGDGKGGG